MIDEIGLDDAWRDGKSDSELRRLLARLRSHPPAQDADHALARMLHELQVHQIELELQNRELRAAQSALESSRDRYAELYDYAPVGYLTLDDKGVIRRINLSGARLFGLERGRLQGTAFSRYLAAEEAERFFGHLRAVFDSGNRQVVDLNLVHCDGEHHPVRLESTPAGETEPRGFCHALLFDITQEKSAREEQARLQRELQQAQKMESIGLLAGGISHDFNNILSIIIGYGELALEQFGTAPEELQRGRLEQVVKAGRRGRDLVRRLLDFSQRRQERALALSLHRKVSETLPMLRATLTPSITLRARLKEDLPAVLMDPAAFDQLLMNLCVNARDAMSGRGCIDIRLHRVHLDSLECDACHRPVVGDWVALDVIDTGIGISSADRRRLFDPFFTTKPPGSGTGLGLSMVYTILHNNGAHVLVESRPGRGSRFRLLFPPARAAGRHHADSTVPRAVAPRPAGDGLHVVVVDDEAAIARLLTELLAGDGYQVSAFSDPHVAWSELGNGTQGIDLLITDQTMPGMTGADLARRLRSRLPGLPVILCSGGCSEMDGSLSAESPRMTRFLQKPVDAASLRAVVDELLRGIAR